MITNSNSCFRGIPNEGLPNYGNFAHHHHEDQMVSSSSSSTSTSTTSFLYNLSILRDKVQQVQSLATLFISFDHNNNTSQPNNSESMAIAIASMETLIQEIIVTSSSMMFTCQQLALGVGSTSTGNNQGAATGELLPQQDQWYADHDHSYNINTCYNTNIEAIKRDKKIVVEKVEHIEEGLLLEQVHENVSNNYDIVELDAANLLAKYTHYCQVCGKGFKRDANLRMHMRAHGDEYKSSASLINPLKKNNYNNNNEEEGAQKLARKLYSCPQEGCRWNKKHEKFQPLKSMICVKNHYKRSHCPKMYVCKRCNRKKFSVLSDLRTHEKHCGDVKWQCSCGTTFSRKDKLMGHVSLFLGHSPAITSLAKMRKLAAHHHDQNHHVQIMPLPQDN
ncbi:hypothetical protein M9H77_16293 [Catharanthus roseus]|uniref:Uncharacterized protein n=1 Tax=Catharanthus roseus TaxID=4058 RepID=A0ACC0B1C9_CATRO|nr:hypothetical protein M9H77_16293 [Catharanthus roseus]